MAVIQKLTTAMKLMIMSPALPSTGLMVTVCYQTVYILVHAQVFINRGVSETCWAGRVAVPCQNVELSLKEATGPV